MGDIPLIRANAVKKLSEDIQLQLVQDKYEDVRTALAYYGTEAVQHKLVNDSSDYVRKILADGAALNVRKEIALHDRDNSVRHIALQSLAIDGHLPLVRDIMDKEQDDVMKGVIANIIEECEMIEQMY